MSRTVPNSDRTASPAPWSNWEPAVCGTIHEAEDYFRFNSHMCWDVDFERGDAVMPAVMDRKIGEICLRRISSGAVRAHRGSAEIRNDHAAYFCLSFITSGYEVLDGGGRQLTLESGDIATWHSTRTSTFVSAKPVQKLSIYVPEASMERILVSPARYAGLYLKHNSGITSLLASYLAGLCSNFAMKDDRTETDIEDVTLNLIGAAIAAPKKEAGTSPRLALWERATVFIDRNLENPELKPLDIANALGMSLRGLHLLFAEQNHTVAGWIRSRRLEYCRAELAKSRAGQTVMEVAFRWGFNDAAHFSRTFKAYYGLSPRSFQQKRAF